MGASSTFSTLAGEKHHQGTPKASIKSGGIIPEFQSNAKPERVIE
jgi:hypothetical protein